MREFLRSVMFFVGNNLKKWRWDHSIYDKIIGICIALTNAHIDIQPLRDDECKVYRSLLSEYTQLAHEQMEREKAATQEKIITVKTVSNTVSLVSKHCLNFGNTYFYGIKQLSEYCLGHFY